MSAYVRPFVGRHESHTVTTDRDANMRRMVERASAPTYRGKHEATS